MSSDGYVNPELLCQGCKHVQRFYEDTWACMHPTVAVPSVVKPNVTIGVNVICVRPKQCKGDWMEPRA